MILKHLRQLIILNTLVCNCFSQIYCPTEEKYKGPVISVKEKFYELPERNFILNRRNTINDTIKLIEISLVKIKDSLIFEKQIFSPNNLLECSCKLIYDKKNYLIGKSTFKSDGRIDTRYTNKWKKGQLIRIDRYNSFDSLFSSTVIKVDTKKHTKLSKELVGKQEENLIYSELNENNQPLKEYTVDNLGVKKLFAEYKYDSESREIETHIWNYNIRYDQHYLTFYDSNSRVINRKWFTRDGEFMGADSIVYDKNSNIIFEHSYDFNTGNWINVTYEYQFDLYGNLLKIETWDVIADEKKLKRRIIREYTYKNN